MPIRASKSRPPVLILSTNFETCKLNTGGRVFYDESQRVRRIRYFTHRAPFFWILLLIVWRLDSGRLYGARGFYRLGDKIPPILDAR